MSFIDEISGLAMVKLLDLKTGSTNTMKVNFVKNIRFLNVTNISSEQCFICKDDALGIVDFRPIHYIIKLSRVSYCTM